MPDPPLEPGFLPEKTLVVGVVQSPGALRCALALQPGDVDALELRVDHFARDPTELREAADRLNAPLIVTVRHPLEGGSNSLSLGRRRELYENFLPLAAFLDVEVRSCRALGALLATAHATGVPVIVSDHHFRSTPPLLRLKRRLSAAQRAGASIFKIASFTSTPADVAVLLLFLYRNRKKPMSVMGMGPFGKISRLLLARAGSVLNYGYLDQAQVPGQWEARLLKRRLREIDGLEDQDLPDGRGS